MYRVSVNFQLSFSLNVFYKDKAKENKYFLWIYHPPHHLLLALKVLWDNYGGGLLWALLQGLTFHSITW